MNNALNKKSELVGDQNSLTITKKDGDLTESEKIEKIQFQFNLCRYK